eukprot:813944-Amphidinium_carterae.1
MIHKCAKSLRILDFNRIKDKERKAASLLFAGDRGKKLLEEIAPPRVVSKDPMERMQDEVKTGPAPEVIERIKKAISEAETIEEVTRLERALKSGVLPDDLKLDEDKAEDVPAAGEAPTTAPAEEPAAAAEAPAEEAPAAAPAAALEPEPMKVDG